ncbi:MAG: ABC transporter permease [Brevefilum sp.]|jgi:ribose transport system permease protein
MKNMKNRSFYQKLKNGAKYAYQEGTVYIILIALVIMFTILNPTFFSKNNLINLLTGSTFYLIAGMGICFVMISGGIDLSVGFQMAMVSCISAMLMKLFDFPAWSVFPIGMALGFIMGTINGIIVAKLKLFPLIVTLATSMVFKGIIYAITQSKSFSGMPDSFRWIYKNKWFGLPVDVYIALAVVLIAWLVLNKTHFGRDVIAVGGNRECSRLSGINIDLIQILCYGICGGIFALAALDMLAQQNMTSAMTGPGTEFVCLTAAIIGGISFMGGKGNVFGLVTGIFVMQIINNGMMLAHMGSYLQYAVNGLILIAAIAFDSIKNRPSLAVRIRKNVNPGSLIEEMAND